MSDQGDVLVLDTSFIIGVAHFISARNITEREGKIMPVTQFIMDFLAEHTSYVSIYFPGLKVRVYRVMP